jgi:hypothetical protein
MLRRNALISANHKLIFIARATREAKPRLIASPSALVGRYQRNMPTLQTGFRGSLSNAHD